MSEILKLARPKLFGYPLQIGANGTIPDDIKNMTVRDILGGLPSFTGHIVVGSPQALDCYEVSKAFVEDPGLMQLFVFWVYDIKTTHPYPLKERLDIAEHFAGTCGVNVQYVDHELLTSEQDIEDYKEKLAGENFTHALLREPYGTHGTEDEEITTSTPM